MAHYVDGFVLPVPKNNLEAYRQVAQQCGEIWREYGALAYVECAADDVKSGEITSFPQSVQLKEEESVVFAWIVYPSREARDSINDKVMKDPRLAQMDTKIFDSKRMIFGGFKKIVDL